MFCLPHFSFGKWSPGGTAPLLRTSLLLSFPGRLRVPPEHSWGVAPWQTHSGSVLPSCFLRALYSSHCSTNVTIVSLHGTLRMRKKAISLWGKGGWILLPPKMLIPGQHIGAVRGCLLSDLLRKMRARPWCGVAGCPVGDHSKFLRPMVASSGVAAGPAHHLRGIPSPF